MLYETGALWEQRQPLPSRLSPMLKFKIVSHENISLQDAVKPEILQQWEYIIEHEYLALLEEYWSGIKKCFDKDLVQCPWSMMNVKWIGPSWHWVIVMGGQLLTVWTTERETI